MYQRRYKRRRPAYRRRSTSSYGSRRYVRGRGSYFSGLPRAMLNTAGGYLGGIGGSLVPVPGAGIIGGALGANAGNKIADIMGLGAYTVKSNSLIMDEGAQIPSFGDMSQAVILKHREYIGDVVVPATPGAFTLNSFKLNPGDSKTFPWLSNVARSFDQFMLLGIIFEFRSTSSDSVGSNIGQGVVIMATDYDATDPPYASKIEMENSQYCTSTKPSESCTHIIECDPSVTAQSHLFIRQQGVPIAGDLRFYDHGNFQIATQGLPTGTSGTIGELWCTYQIAFFKPQLHNSDSLMVAWKGTSNISNTALVGIPAGSANPFVPGSSILTFALDGNTLYFGGAQIGEKYLVVLRIAGSATTTSTGPFLTLTNCALTMNSITFPSTTSQVIQNAWITITNADNPRIQWNAFTVPTSPISSWVQVIRVETAMTFVE